MGLLHRAVLETRRVPVLGSLYRGAYAGAAAGAAAAFYGLEGVVAVHLHRGLTGGTWEPGVSDIDLILVRSPSADAKAERRFLLRLGARRAAVKAAFPMLGDLWIGEEGEVARYLRWGGLRSWEDRPRWRRLLGRPAPPLDLGESPAKRRWLDAWVWVFVNHMEICRRFFGPPAGPAQKRLADCRKLFLDVRRYADSIDGDGEGALLTRSEMQARVPALEAAGLRRLWLDSAARLGEVSAAVLGRLGTDGEGRAALPPPGRQTPCASALARLLAGSGGLCVVRDLPYHTYVVLDDAAGSAALERAADAVLREPPPGVPMVLTAAAWALALQSSYLGAPLGWLGWEGRGGGGAGRGGAFGGWGACALGEPLERLRLLPRRLRWETAAEAASWMALWWRSLWIGPGWTNRFALFHLYTRALGLRLALEGAPTGPYSDWEGLFGRCAARFETERPLLESLGAFFRCEPAECIDRFRREHLAPEHLEALHGFMAGLRRPLDGPAG
ncbi:MAG: hypothetical protein HY927_16570 [Elusimicrobia bacterium]|nr:hypothetical protein [Elusimicrobiota bacterium]